jgi:hypothetical protein
MGMSAIVPDYRILKPGIATTSRGGPAFFAAVCHRCLEAHKLTAEKPPRAGK